MKTNTSAANEPQAAGCGIPIPQVITLDVVAWPDIDPTPVRADDPSDAVRREVGDLYHRAALAVHRQELRAARKAELRASAAHAAERAHSELQNRAYNLQRQLEEQAEEITSLQHRLREAQAWEQELAGLCHDAQRSADKALARWDKLA